MTKLEPIPFSHYIKYKWPINEVIENIIARVYSWIIYPFEGWRKIDQQSLDYAIKWINEQPKESLPHLCSQINCWQWVFPAYKDYYSGLSGCFFRRRNKSTIITPIHTYLNSIVPIKESFRDWHLTKCNHTNEQFEIWWAENGDRVTNYRKLINL